VLRQLAEVDPDRPALTSGETTLTRAEFVERVERLAGLFAARGVTEGSTVTIGLPNSAGLVESLFAAWALGAVPQPISHRLPPLERAAIVDLANPSLVVGGPESEAAGRPALESVPQQLPPGSFTPAVSPVWKLVTSGGSTGRPKLIAATAPALAENVVGLGPALGMRRDGCVLVTGPVSHNAPFVVTATGMLLGNHVVVMPRFDPAETLRLVEAFRVTWMLLVPTMMLRIWRLPAAVRLAADVSSLEVAFHLAAPCPPWLKQEWIGWLGPQKVLELYGGTELQAMTVISGTEWLAHRGSVGRPVIGEIQIRDADGQPVPAGQEGEIWMRRGAGAPPRTSTSARLPAALPTGGSRWATSVASTPAVTCTSPTASRT
jgi:bile acid-coenzyme A ligase